MVKEYYVNPQQRLAIKNRQKKVKQYKVYKEYKKAVSREELNGVLPKREERWPQGAGSEEDRSGSDPAVHRGDKKKHKMSAVDAARRQFEYKQRAEEAEKEVARQEAAERHRQQAAARKRRKTDNFKATKRTSRGQPVLSHQLNKMLASIERG